MASTAPEHERGERERALVYWLNSLPFRSCLVVGSIKDLADGFALAELARELSSAVGIPPPAGRAEGAAGRMAGAIDVLHHALDGEGLDAELAEPHAAVRAARGDARTLATLAAAFARACGSLPPARASRFRDVPAIVPSFEPYARLVGPAQGSQAISRARLAQPARGARTRHCAGVPARRRPGDERPPSPPSVPARAPGASGSRASRASVAQARQLLDFDVHFASHRMSLPRPSLHLSLVRECAAAGPAPADQAAAPLYAARALDRRSAPQPRAGASTAAAARAAQRATASSGAHARALHEGETVRAAAALFPAGALQRLEGAMGVGARARAVATAGTCADCASVLPASELAAAAGAAVETAARCSPRSARRSFRRGAPADAAAAAVAAASASDQRAFQGGWHTRALASAAHATRLPPAAASAMDAALALNAAGDRAAGGAGSHGVERTLEAARSVSLGTVGQAELLRWLRSFALVPPHVPLARAAERRAMSAPAGGGRAPSERRVSADRSSLAWATSLPVELRGSYDVLMAFQTGALACQLVSRVSGVRLVVSGADAAPAHACTRAARARNFGRALAVARARCGSALEPSLHAPDADARLADGDSPLLWALLEGLHRYSAAQHAARAPHAGARARRGARWLARGEETVTAGSTSGAASALEDEANASSDGGDDAERGGADDVAHESRAPSLGGWLALGALAPGELRRSGVLTRAEYEARVWLRRRLGQDVPWGTHARRLHPLRHPLTNGALAARVALGVRTALRPSVPAPARTDGGQPQSLEGLRSLWREALADLAALGVHARLDKAELDALASGHDRTGWQLMRRIARATARSRLLLRPLPEAEAAERAEADVLRWLDRTGIAAALAAGDVARARGRVRPPTEHAAARTRHDAAGHGDESPLAPPQPAPELPYAWARARPAAAESIAAVLLDGSALSAAVHRATAGGRSRSVGEHPDARGWPQRAAASPPVPMLAGTAWPVRSAAAAQHNVSLACAALGAHLSARAQLDALRDEVCDGRLGSAVRLLSLALLVARRRRKQLRASRRAAGWRAGGPNGGDDGVPADTARAHGGEPSDGSDGEEGDRSMEALAAAMEHASAMPRAVHPTLAAGGGPLDIAWDELLAQSAHDDDGGRSARAPRDADARRAGAQGGGSPTAHARDAAHASAQDAAVSGELRARPVAWDELLSNGHAPRARTSDEIGGRTRTPIDGTVPPLSPPAPPRRVRERELALAGKRDEQRARAIAAELVGGAPLARAADDSLGALSAPAGAADLRGTPRDDLRAPRSVAWDVMRPSSDAPLGARSHRALAAKLSDWVRERSGIALTVHDLCSPAIGVMSDGLILAQLTGACARACGARLC